MQSNLRMYNKLTITTTTKKQQFPGDKRRSPKNNLQSIESGIFVFLSLVCFSSFSFIRFQAFLTYSSSSPSSFVVVAVVVVIAAVGLLGINVASLFNYSTFSDSSNNNKNNSDTTTSLCNFNFSGTMKSKNRFKSS